MQKTHRIRVLTVATLSFLVFVAIVVRLYVVQVRMHDGYRALAEGQQEKTVVLDRRRGDILDRNGIVLATSTFYDSVYFNPKLLGKHEFPEELVERIAEVLDTPVERLAPKFEKTHVVPIWRKIPPDRAERIRMLEQEFGLPDGVLFYRKESKRLYPQADLAGPIVGYTKIDDTGDNIGQEGLERQYDERLRGETRKVRIPVNVWRQGLVPLDEQAMRETFGKRVVSTIDSRLQHFAQKALRRKVGEVQAHAGVAVVMDVATGDILAMANCPDFDPNEFVRAAPEQRRNRALTDPIEIGSVMKILTAAILLDNGLVGPEEPVDCQGGRGYVDGRKFTDSHALGVVPFSHAFAESSNIAAAKLGLRIPPDLYYESLRKFGMGDRLGVDLPGENSGVLRPVSQWTRLSRTSLPVGYETSMTALQVVSALSAICNDGVRMRPRFVRAVESADGKVVEEIPPVEDSVVASAETCRTLLGLMEKVVSEGTGGKASIPGYSSAGKTGTTRKVMPGRHYISSFAGCIPASDPRIVCYVYVDEPDPSIAFYGGSVAAPVFAEIGAHAVRLLGVPPDRPEIETADADAVAGAGPEHARVENVDGEEPTAKELALDEREAALAETLAEDAPFGEESEDAPDGGPEDAVGSSAPAFKSLDDVRRLRETAPYDPTASLLAADSPVVPGVVPLCVGLTMAEVVEKMAEAGIPFRMEGGGVAIRQTPRAGTRPAAGVEAVVEFALPSRRMEPHAPDPESAPREGSAPRG